MGGRSCAIVLFSAAIEKPFLYLDPADLPESEIPVITVSRQGIEELLSAQGMDGAHVLEELGSGTSSAKSRSLISNLRLHIDGAFDHVETDHFTFLYRGRRIPRNDIEAVASIHEDAVATIMREIGDPATSEFPQSMTVYFAGYDSKVFFTHHWGRGLSSAAGTFLIWSGVDIDSGTIVHEHTHTYVRKSWGESSSFMSEGIAKFVEAQATDPDENHRRVLQLMNEDQLPPLQKLLYIDIGSDELTRIAYPAAGSFTGFLLETLGMKKFRQAFSLEHRTEDDKHGVDTWEKTYGTSIAELDRQWRDWLRTEHQE